MVGARSQDTTAGRHHLRGGPWAQEDQGLLQGAGQEDQEPPDWLPGQASPQQHHILLLEIAKVNLRGKVKIISKVMVSPGIQIVE